MKPTNERLYNPRIDQLRAAAFLGVASLHFFTPTYVDVIRSTPVINLIEPFISNGYMGVSLFFMLSGHILAKLAIQQGGEVHYGQFMLNRVLRIYPLWIVCLLLVMYQGHLSGATMITSMLLFVQDLPATPWNVAWSVQQEFYLYLAFPVLFANLTRIRHFAAVLGMCIAIRAAMSYNMTPQLLRNVSYSTIMGTVTLFVTPAIVIPKAYRLLLVTLSIVALWLLAALINRSGGFFFAAGGNAHWVFWFFFPEMMAVVFAFLLIGYDLAAPHKAVGRVGWFFETVGKISYSGYLLHVLVIDFTRQWLARLGLAPVNPFLEFAIYMALLLPLAWCSFNVIEKPFLKFRKKYVSGNAGPEPSVKLAA